MNIPVDSVLVNPDQPRQEFDPDELQTLADSIKEHGLIQPISVEGPMPGGEYILIDGERRWRAHQMLGLHLNRDRRGQVYGEISISWSCHFL